MVLEKYIKGIIENIDPDCSRLEDTPARASVACKEFFSGYETDMSRISNSSYDSEMDDLIILKNIQFQSCCEHHIAPIVGFVSIGYVPNKRIIGASKLARIVDCFARRLQLQERMTIEIARTLDSVLNNNGVGVYVEAEHFCISHRGVKKHGTRFITRYFTGVMKSDLKLRQEFLSNAIAIKN